MKELKRKKKDFGLFYFIIFLQNVDVIYLLFGFHLGSPLILLFHLLIITYHRSSL